MTSRFSGVAVRPLQLSTHDAVKFATPANAEVPLVASPSGLPVNLADWARLYRDELRDRLLLHGAILFREFRIGSPSAFENVIATLFDAPSTDSGEHPLVRENSAIYSPTTYPADRQIFWHNENSFLASWPKRIAFCCVEAPGQGGETPLVDCAGVLRTLDPAIVTEFEAKGILYQRNFGGGMGLSWQEAFKTCEQSVVEQFCRRNGFEFEWRGAERLRMVWRRPAVIDHPETGMRLWFNQVTHFHTDMLEDSLRLALFEMLGPKDLPRACYYGDGTVIRMDTVESICAAYRQNECCFPWKAGDVLVVDNARIAHARRPYQGPRRLLIALDTPTAAVH